MKTSVYFPPELKKALKRVARERKSSEAQILRSAVARMAAEAEVPAPNLPLFRSNGRSIAESVDETLARQHRRCAAAMLSARPPRILSRFVLAELDYLIGERVGQTAPMAPLDEVVKNAYQLEPFSGEDVAHAKRMMQRYSELEIGIADSSVVVLSQRYATLDVLCTDQRHFRTLRGHGGKPFRLLPFDQ